MSINDGQQPQISQNHQHHICKGGQINSTSLSFPSSSAEKKNQWPQPSQQLGGLHQQQQSVGAVIAISTTVAAGSFAATNAATACSAQQSG